MANMTKATARKRLVEARAKIMRVLMECKDLPTRENNELYKIGNQILNIRNKIK